MTRYASLRGLEAAVAVALERCTEQGREPESVKVSVVIPHFAQEILVYQDDDIFWIIGDNLVETDEFAELDAQDD